PASHHLLSDRPSLLFSLSILERKKPCRFSFFLFNGSATSFFSPSRSLKSPISEASPSFSILSAFGKQLMKIITMMKREFLCCFSTPLHLLPVPWSPIFLITHSTEGRLQ
ncbi:hypothetical protein LINPERPRIM_LOCUS5056, partial [Linum perenne]